jgi:hypothetical protein
MTKDNNGDDFEVGYKKPPKHSQFKPGQSGNRKGKPKKNTTLQEEVNDIFMTQVPVMKNNKKAYVTKRQLMLEQIINGGINKDPRMMRYAVPLLTMTEDMPEFELLPEDIAALQELKQSLNHGSEKE